MHVYSAYYDDRKRSQAKEGSSPVIRINVLAPKSFNVKNKKTGCLVKLKEGVAYIVRIQVIKLLEHFNMLWSSYYANCKLTEPITKALTFDNQTKSANNKIDKDNIESVVLINQDMEYHNTNGRYNFSYTLLGELKVHKYGMSNQSNQNLGKHLVPDQNVLAICVKPVYLHWNRAIWLVEFFEMYLVLGRSKYIFGGIFIQ